MFSQTPSAGDILSIFEVEVLENNHNSIQFSLIPTKLNIYIYCVCNKIPFKSIWHTGQQLFLYFVEKYMRKNPNLQKYQMTVYMYLLLSKVALN